MKFLVLTLILVISSASSYRRHHHRPYGDDGDEDSLNYPSWWAPKPNRDRPGRDFGPEPRSPFGDDEGPFGSHGGRWHPWGRPTTTDIPRITYPIYLPTTQSATIPTDRAIEACKATCLVTNEYRPVCGTDNLTYPNIGRLECARSCGVAVQLSKKTACFAPIGLAAEGTEACMSTCSVTSEYNPVCGTNNVTYPNAGRLECARNCGLNVEISRRSSCSVPPGPNNPDLRGSTESPNGNGNGSGNGSGSGGVSGSAGGNGSGIGNGSDNGSGSSNGSGSGNKNITMTEILACMQLCPITTEINALCGTDGVTYGNPGKLLCAQFCGVDVKVQKFAPCQGKPIPNPSPFVCPTLPTPTDVFTNPPTTQDCINKCFVSQEFRPVCGTNGVTYINIESLQCNKKCGVGVSVLKLAPCGQTSIDQNTAPTPSASTTTPTPNPTYVETCINQCTTSQNYNPVCGTDGVTYDNLPKLQCAKRCGISVELKSLSSCYTFVSPSGMQGEKSTEVNNLGFTIPADLLASVFPEATPSSTTEQDESYEIDIKFGTVDNTTTKVL